MWASRGQAQNAADAAALAGAIARAYDDFGDKSATGPAVRAALAMAAQHRVFGEPPNITAADVTFPLCPDGTDACVRVDVFRNAGRSPLPTFFARLVGVNEQGVRATATAQAAIGNATNCLKPWAVADKWAERRPVTANWTTTSTFDRYDNKGVLLADPVDYYIPPGESGPGTGFHPFNEDGTLSSDYGLKITLKFGDPNDESQLQSGWFQPLALTNSVGGNDYRTNIASCVGGSYEVGNTITTEPGNMIGPTKQGVGDLVAKDPGAHWDLTLNGGRGGVAGSAYANSPRIVPIPLFNVQEFMSRDPTGRNYITITNILGFFVAGMNGNDVEGYLMTLPGEFLTGSSSVSNSAAWVRTVRLVR
jgi:hypothetical protein